jgi:hypothetical protein
MKIKKVGQNNLPICCYANSEKRRFGAIKLETYSIPPPKPFEETQAWQPARELTRKVYNLTKKLEFSNDYGFKK